MLLTRQSQNKHIREISPDIEKISSILKMCEVRLRFINKQEVDNETASLISEGYYEIIKELLTALLLKNGLKSDNHECLISFFKHTHPDKEYEVQIIHALKNVRNRINYDGIFVEESYLTTNKLEFQHIIESLIKLISNN